MEKQITNLEIATWSKLIWIKAIEICYELILFIWYFSIPQLIDLFVYWLISKHVFPLRLRLRLNVLLMRFMITSAFMALQTLILNNFSIILCETGIHNLICSLSSNTVIFTSVFSLHSFWDETLPQTWYHPTALLIFTGELQFKQSYAWITVFPSILTIFAITFVWKVEALNSSTVILILALSFWVTVVVSVVFKARLSLTSWIINFVRL